MRQDQFSRWNSTKVKAKYNYTCAECGATENIQAHDPTGEHKDWRVGIALCGDCHSKEHPDVPRKLFSIKGHQPYWPNISARTLAKKAGCHNRTIIRRAKALKIPSGIPLSSTNEQRLLHTKINKRNQKIWEFYQKGYRYQSIANIFHIKVGIVGMVILEKTRKVRNG